MKRGGGPSASRGGVREDLKRAMRLFPQGVTVVTTQGEQGPTGLTVSSFISVSLEPPLVLVSLGRGSDLHDSFVGAEAFAVNLLSGEQRSVSERFAKVGAPRRFEGVAYRKGTGGSPLIVGARGTIECRVWRVYDGGDHSLIVGKVVRASSSKKGGPLVYHNQRYTTTAD